MLAIGYAAHFLRLGQYRLKSPLIRVNEGGQVVSISRFEEEVERVCFFDGTLVLGHRDFSEAETNVLEVNLEEFLKLIGQRLSELDFCPPTVSGT